MSIYLAYLHSIGLSQKNLINIFETKNNFKDFFEKLSFESLSKYSIKDEKVFEIMSNYKSTDFSKIEKILREEEIKLVTIFDENYPELLKKIPNPPFLLYVKGILRNNCNLLSIVGSRKNTRYSQTVLEKIIPNLIGANFGIVSGGAYGVDSLAHNITLKNNGYTISVIGTGVDQCYPTSNKTLYENIVNNSGAIVSIFRLGTGPESYNFPIRNEIIAGLSKGTIITEAGEKSGTLITAQLALELNRDVFVVPGDIGKETSIGANKLIKDGLGKLITGYEDILEEYNIGVGSGNTRIETKIFADKIEQKIFDEISKNPLDASSLSDKLNIDIEIIGYKLSILEICGHIELGQAGNYYIK